MNSGAAIIWFVSQSLYKILIEVESSYLNRDTNTYNVHSFMIATDCDPTKMRIINTPSSDVLVMLMLTVSTVIWELSAITLPVTVDSNGLVPVYNMATIRATSRHSIETNWP